MFWSEVAISHVFVKVTFQKARVFFAREPWGPDRNLGRTERVLLHMEVRTLYARRMFREKGSPKHNVSPMPNKNAKRTRG